MKDKKRHNLKFLDEYLAKWILEDLFPQFGTFEKGESPDLQNKELDIGFEVTRAFGKNQEILENKIIPELVKSGYKFIVHPTRTINEKDYEHHKTLLMNGIENKTDKDYGFAKNGLFLYSYIEIPGDAQLKDLCSTVCSKCKGKYDYILIYQVSDEAIIFIDTETESINIQHFDCTVYTPRLQEKRVEILE